MSTDPYDVFDLLSAAKLEDFGDLELLELHQRAASHFEEAAVADYEGEKYTAVYEWESAKARMDEYNAVKKWKSALYLG